MSDLDQARELVKSTLFSLDDPLRPQDAADVVADLTRLAAAVGTLIDRTSQRLASADRLPGLYTTTPNADPRDELLRARAALTAAQHAAGTLAAGLDEAHNTLATIGHGDTTSSPLGVAGEHPEPTRHPGWRQVD